MMNEHTLLVCAAALVEVAAQLDIDGAMPVTWRQGVRCCNSPFDSERRVGYRILMYAIANTPNGAQRIIEALARRLDGDAA